MYVVVKENDEFDEQMFYDKCEEGFEIWTKPIWSV